MLTKMDLIQTQNAPSPLHKIIGITKLITYLIEDFFSDKYFTETQHILIFVLPPTVVSLEKEDPVEYVVL